METDAERGLDWVALPVIATVARLLCRELTPQNEYLRLATRPDGAPALPIILPSNRPASFPDSADGLLPSTP